MPTLRRKYAFMRLKWKINSFCSFLFCSRLLLLLLHSLNLLSIHLLLPVDYHLYLSANLACNCNKNNQHVIQVSHYTSPGVKWNFNYKERQRETERERKNNHLISLLSGLKTTTIIPNDNNLKVRKGGGIRTKS